MFTQVERSMGEGDKHLQVRHIIKGTQNTTLRHCLITKHVLTSTPRRTSDLRGGGTPDLRGSSKIKSGDEDHVK
jgi:hypothetical protein